MLSETNPFITPLKKITETDSLRQSLFILENKVDSLQSVVLKTEIGTGYFTYIIALQLTIFVVLIGAGGLISWNQIIKRLRNDREELLNTAENIINDKTRDIDQAVENLKIIGQRTAYNSSRALYRMHLENGDHLILFQWALASAAFKNGYDPTAKKDIELWLNLAFEHIEKVPKGTDIKTLAKRFDEHINTLSTSKIEGIDVSLDRIKHIFFSVYYSC